MTSRKSLPKANEIFFFQSPFHLLGQLTNLMEMGQNFLPLGFNLLNRLTGIAVNPRIRNHQTRFYTQLQRVKADIPDEFNGLIAQTSLGIQTAWIHMGNGFCSIDQDF